MKAKNRKKLIRAKIDAYNTRNPAPFEVWLEERKVPGFFRAYRLGAHTGSSVWYTLRSMENHVDHLARIEHRDTTVYETDSKYAAEMADSLARRREIRRSVYRF